MQASRIPSSSGQLDIHDSVQDNTRHLRNLSHELSNALDTVLQASYLLEQSKLSPSTRNWVKMISNSAQDAAAHNREIREALRRLLPAPEDISVNEKPNLQLVENANRKTRPAAKRATSQRKTKSSDVVGRDKKREHTEEGTEEG